MSEVTRPHNLQYVSEDELIKACNDFYIPWCCDNDSPEEMICKAVGVCTECGCPVDKDGEAVAGCGYSPVECDVCGFRHCDDSC